MTLARDSVVAPPRFDTLSAYLRHWAAVTPDQLALYEGDESLDWSELDQLVDSVAERLALHGVTAGDRVMLVGLNTFGWIATFLAVQRMGATIAPTNNRISPSQMRVQADALEAALVVVDDERLAAVAEALEGSTIGSLELELLMAEVSASPQSSVVATDGFAPDAPALVSFTSGTTGVPKGAVIGHAALVNMALAFATYFESGPQTSTLVMVPAFHNTGFVDQFAHVLVAGGATGLLRRYSTRRAVEELSERPVTYLAGVPSMFRMLMEAPRANEVFGTLEKIMYGGSPMPGAWSHELHSRYPHLGLVHAYGLSEFTSVCTFLPPELVLTKGESVGLPLPGVEVNVIDSDGVTVPVGNSGEVVLRGATCMDGYWRQTALTAEKFSGDWLRTGDIGHLDADGLLWLQGRVDDVINRGAEKILPSHVESCITRFADVREASVFGYHDPVLQQRVAAAITLHDGTTYDESLLRAHLVALLPDYAIPDQWVVYDELPLTGSGKVDRRAVAAAFAARADAS
jgi:long-chain acyl-CoA synthetase